MDIVIETNPALWVKRLLARLFGRSGWGSEETYLEQLDQGHMLVESNVNIIVVNAMSPDRNQLLGHMRAELLVDPDYRRRGIGTRLIDEVIQRTRHTALYAGIFTGTEAFFEKFGLIPRSMLIAVSRKPLTTQPS
ncbi:MAG: GNAT family N-acetyltransferase [Thiobacillus sp.]|nr:GNAT family N-acetyltransferase [Thiobacillus sp.]